MKSISSGTVLGQLAAILEDKDEYRKLVSQEGELAQSLLDLLQSLLPSVETSSQLHTSVLNAILRLSRRSNLYPLCLVMEGVELLGEHPVASGGFGDIWMGAVKGSEEAVCLKVVKLYQTSNTEKVINNFVQEAIVWKQLNHPNLLPFFGLCFLGSNKQRLCLMSPWMKNGNLIQYLERTPRADVNRPQLVWDVVDGLRYLHQMNIIHADLKGVNILITESGRATLGDFGLSNVADGEVLRMSSSSAFLGGTPRWLAPELLMPESRPSYESDIYAFGCVCYEIYTGLRPFYNLRSDAAVILQIMKGNRPLRPDNTPELNDNIWVLIRQCWAVEPSSRPDIEVVRERLHFLYGAIDAASPWDLILSKHIRLSARVDDSSFDNQQAVMFLSQSHEKLRPMTIVGEVRLCEPLAGIGINYHADPGNLSSSTSRPVHTRRVRPLPPTPGQNPPSLPLPTSQRSTYSTEERIPADDSRTTIQSLQEGATSAAEGLQLTNNRRLTVQTSPPNDAPGSPPSSQSGNEAGRSIGMLQTSRSTNASHTAAHEGSGWLWNWNRGKGKEHFLWREGGKSDGTSQSELTKFIGYFIATGQEDWPLALDICEIASSHEAFTEEAIYALGQEFKCGGPAAQLSAARLWAIMLRNSDQLLIAQAKSQRFLNILENLIRGSETEPVVKERVLDILAAAAFTLGERYPGFRDLWVKVKPVEKPDEGVPFDTNDDMLNPPTMSALRRSLMVSNPPLRRSGSGQDCESVMSVMSTLFQTCTIGMNHANLLVRTLLVDTPEDVKWDSRIEELKAKCLASKEAIATQIPWASASAEQSRRERDAKKEADMGMGIVRGSTSTYADQQTSEEKLLADVLEVNAELNRAINICWSFQAAKIGMKNADLLVRASRMPSPNDSHCRTLMEGCLASRELIVSQLEWVFSGVGQGCLGTGPKDAHLVEERLSADLLKANEELNKAINLYLSLE